MYKIITSAMLLISSNAVFAGSSGVQGNIEPGLNIVLEASVFLGGDSVGTRSYENNDSSSSIGMMEGFGFGGGLAYQLPESPFGIKSTLAYKTNAADIEHKANIINVIPYYQTGDHRFGLGLTYHISPELTANDVYTTQGSYVDNYKEQYENATGLIAEYRWYWMQFQVGSVKYTEKTVGLKYNNTYFSIAGNFFFQL
ncbi:hypothetical protein [Pelagibaculum spongiae]|uniref:Outer membrane protein beta-barrel domain-containing protein n=1 Tax=Pelagibaculum spongiae TaxID=2080658 RepID=A0A2V1GXF5_9GAMM|nr:hypothetical protein [Pelagibaculum spongiae]PVZ65713.1 hypothetical protein DC094_17695 [Pelagibaculum spongiae]